LTLPVHTNTGEFCVGDWVLAHPETEVLHRLLKRRTVLERRTEGGGTPQLAAANVDTLFIVTSCNADFNVARLEGYLALANQAGTTPVILLTKPDAVDNVQDYIERARALQRELPVVALNPRVDDARAALAQWCDIGQTVALVGSSGVGKSTLVNTLADPGAKPAPRHRRNPRARRKGSSHHDLALHPCHCGWRVGDRHTRNAEPSGQRHGPRNRHPLR
jgi:ribosome biogenesis GTPase